MARRVVRSSFVVPKAADLENAQARAHFAEIGDKPKSKRSPDARSANALRRACEEFEGMRATGIWSNMCVEHFIALYACLHREVYGVEPAELLKAFPAARSAARKMLDEEFASSIERMFDFMRWIWKRERDVEKRRRHDGTSGRRIDWRLQFATRHLLTDYKVQLARTGAKVSR